MYVQYRATHSIDSSVFTIPTNNNTPLTLDIPVTVGEKNLVYIVYLATFSVTEKYMVWNDLVTVIHELKKE